MLLLLAALPLLAQYDPALQYQNRGNRYEGLKPKPVSGYDIELLSALVDWREPSPAWPQTLHLKFYLPAAEPVFITGLPEPAGIRPRRSQGSPRFLGDPLVYMPWADTPEDLRRQAIRRQRYCLPFTPRRRLPDAVSRG